MPDTRHFGTKPALFDHISLISSNIIQLVTAFCTIKSKQEKFSAENLSLLLIGCAAGSKQLIG